jgi:hypothetical protein|tara:strand:- start:347 stop:466 length:120 start_codon:yes stop_codon:yes gene_type:complete
MVYRPSVPSIEKTSKMGKKVALREEKKTRRKGKNLQNIT